MRDTTKTKDPAEKKPVTRRRKPPSKTPKAKQVKAPAPEPDPPTSSEIPDEIQDSLLYAEMFLAEDASLRALYEVLQAEIAAFGEASRWTTITEHQRQQHRLPVTEAVVGREWIDDEAGWRKIGEGPGVLQLNDSERLRILKQCTHLYYRDGYARNIIRLYTFLIKSSGLSISFPEQKDAQGKLANRWHAIGKAIGWSRFVTQTLLLTLLQGERFVLRFPYVKDADGWNTRQGRPDWERIRRSFARRKPEEFSLCSLSPLEVEEVVPCEINRERPRYFKVSSEVIERLRASGVDLGEEGKRGYLSACSMTQFAIEDFDGLRGRPILEPVLKDLAHLRLYKTDRLMMTAIRARIPLIRKVKNFRRKGVRHAMAVSGLPRAGTVATVDADEEWIHPGGPTDGGSAEKDLRQLKLDICAGVSLPEYLVTSDGSNGSYASTLVQSSPTIMLINHYREQFAETFEELITPLIGEYTRVQFPELVYSDYAGLVKALLALYGSGVLSKATLRAKLGLDDEDEDQKIDQERDDADPYDLSDTLDEGDEQGEDE
jgi:hypothetical protein